MTPLHLGFMVLINLIWGFALIAAKVSLDHFPPLLFAALRFTLIVLVLFPFLKIHKGRMKQVIIIALCAGPVGFGFFFVGLALSNASVVAVTSQLGVPFATIMSIVFLKEQVHWRRWLGISLSFLGVMVISFDPVVFTYIDGLLFVVASAFVGSIGTIFQRQIKNVGVFELQAWVAVAAAPLMLGASAIFESGSFGLIMTADLLDWAGVFYVAFASSLVGHAGIYYLLQRYEVTQTAPLTLLSPVFTVFFAVTLLGEILTTRMIVGALIALTGVLIVSIRQKRIVDTGP
ncbi:DMT family transporter [Parvibaculum sp.]|uniref:DMT family transporter n=1 Tax=Parvibaculum sp. TaxID=2024848 RepID=UPI0027308A50|nr:DMT family transporter [Parvibaculum sp.]MDP1626962.1 DMT family transporter [Parvibaculum sp.]MDP2151642.1 DMT family transporter [Parvibaculum sp.]MDP3327591.1 DMT family transporter [Parvibaculum sp.]